MHHRRKLRIYTDLTLRILCTRAEMPRFLAQRAQREPSLSQTSQGLALFFHSFFFVLLSFSFPRARRSRDVRRLESMGFSHRARIETSAHFPVRSAAVSDFATTERSSKNDASETNLSVAKIWQSVTTLFPIFLL